MRKIFPALFFALFFAICIFAQTPTPTPKPVGNDDDVVKISTTLIQIDVTVTDKKGKIVSNLKPEDFEIFENDEKQAITNFSFVDASSNPPPKSNFIVNKNEIAPPIPSVQLKPEQVNRTIALIIDDLWLSFESTYSIQQALRKFVNEQMQPNDLVAIIRTGGGIGALQQFTSNKNQLHAAIDKIRYRFNRVETAFSTIGEDIPTGLPKERRTTSTVDQIEKEVNEFRDSIFTIGTLGAINYVVRGMDELPGKKNIMLFSDGFTICPRSDPTACSKILKSLRELTELCNRASVTIYTQDARGLQTVGIEAKDRVENIAQAQAALLLKSSDISYSQDGLRYLANETGGRAILNSNNLNSGLEKLLEETSGFYLLGYQPDSDTFDAKTRKFNKLTVKVKGQDLKVRYRSGFFGVADADFRPQSSANLTVTQQIHRAITSPFAENGISLKLNTLFGKSDKDGSFMRSFLHVEGKDLTFTNEPNGSKKASFNILAVSFGENGVPIDQIAKTYTLTATKESYEKIVREGFVYNFVFPIKKAGAYQMRVALRDTNSSQVGSAHQFIEVPELKKGRHTLSGIMLENLTQAQWNKLQKGLPLDSKTDPMTDTSLRRFKKGTALRYALDVYNAKLDKTNKPDLSTQTIMFRDGRKVFEGGITPYNADGQSNPNSVNFTGALVLGGAMEAGDYILQIIVIDNLQKEKRKLATQWVQFEVIE